VSCYGWPSVMSSHGHLGVWYGVNYCELYWEPACVCVCANKPGNQAGYYKQ